MSLEALARQKESTTSLLSLVKTMKALAGVSVRSYQSAAASLDAYEATLESGLQVLFRGGQLQMTGPSSRSRGAVVIGTDQGMCGPFNEAVLNQLSSAEERPAVCLVVGSRLLAGVEPLGWKVGRTASLPSSVTGIAALVLELLEEIDSWRRQGVSIVDVFSNVFNGSHYRSECQRLWPLDAQLLADLMARPWPSRSLPTWVGEKDDCLHRLSRQWLFVRLYRCVASSLAAEQTARLTSMQAAQKNIGERLEELERRFNSKRQENITSELLDIVSGFEALS